MKKSKFTKSLSAVLLLACGFTNIAYAEDVEIKEVIIAEKNVKMNLALNPKTVRCLVGDYGASSLKISVPELNKHTVFQHTTEGESAPCINAGRCDDLKNPERFLYGSKSNEEADVKITLTKVFQIDHKNKTCNVRLKEHVATKVNGLNFRHVDGESLTQIPKYESCL